MAEDTNNSCGKTYNIENAEHLHIGDKHYHYHTNQPVESSTPTTSQAHKQLPGVFTQTFADRIKRAQAEKVNSADVVTHDKQIKDTEIPEVHPILVETDIYEGHQPDQNEEFVPSTTQKDDKSHTDKTTDFTTLLSLIMTTHFLALVGPAGSGKTTLSKRIVRALLNMGRFVILIKFMYLAYPPGFTLTLQDLIVGYQFKELDKEIHDNAFEWMKQNPSECVIVFDGFDQFPWALEDVNPLCASYDTPLSVQQLIANLCSGEFLGKSHLVFTSRQHSMLSLPHDLRPDLTLHVYDLSTDDMKKLFFSFARNSANELWEIISAKSPQLFDLCHNPMLLQFIVYAGLYKGANHLDAITNIFNVVFLQIERSRFAKGLQISKLKELLGRMAYNGMASKKIVFETADLTNEGLKDVDVQDFVIKVPQYLGFPAQRLFEGDMKFFFMHQLLQEFFAAIYIAKHMPERMFEQNIEAVVNESHWSMVRRFLCGLLLGNGVTQGKSEIFFKKLLEYVSLQNLSSDYEKPDDVYLHEKMLAAAALPGASKFKGHKLAEFLVDLQECPDDVKNSLATDLPVVMDFNACPMSLSACHALGDMFPRTPEHPDKSLYLISCKLSFDSLKLISGGFDKIKQKFMTLDLGSNEFGDDGLKLLCKYLGKAQRWGMNHCEFTKHGVEVLVEALERLDRQLMFLNLGGNDIGDDGLIPLFKYLNKARRWWLWGTEITKHGVEVLVEALQRLELPLEKIDLGRNKIGDDELKLLSKYLHKTNALRVWGCEFTKQGVEALADALKRRELPVEELFMSHNALGDDGLKPICECLDKIRSLDVQHCDITESGKELLRKEISKLKLPVEDFLFEEQ